MEKFPNSTEDGNSLVKKIIIGTTTLLMSQGVEAQQSVPHNSTQQESIHVQTSNEQVGENTKILSNLEQLEKSFKKLTKETSKESVPAFAIISESSALRQGSLVPNTLESLLTAEITVDMANQSGTDYKIMSRDVSTLNTLLSERTIGDTYSPDAKNDVLKTYIPINSYITIGTKRTSDTAVMITLRRIDMSTKNTVVKNIEYSLTHEKSIEEFDALESKVSTEVASLMKE